MIVSSVDSGGSANDAPPRDTERNELSMQTDSITSPLFGDPRLSMRFWNKVRLLDNGCWEWTATRWKGYGLFWTKATGRVRAHRLAYQSLVEPIPDGLQVDHLCRNRACVRPAHMEIVTNRENVLRGIGVCAQEARQTHCIHGHPYDLLNTYITPSGKRQCRACDAERRRRYRRERSGNK